MPAKTVELHERARVGIVKGATLVMEAARVTLGPKGRNVMIQRSFGAPTVTKDGVTVVKEIELENRFENMGAKLIREVAQKTSDVAGDGTTTATVLAGAIVREGIKLLAAGFPAMELRRGIDAAVVKAVATIKEMSRPVKERERLEQVATISANGDKSIGKIVADAMDKVGKEGVITVEEARGLDTVLDLVEGMRFDRGYLSPYFVTNADKLTVELDEPLILFHEKKLSNLREILPLLESVVQTGRQLLIIAEDVESEALAALVVNKLRGTIKVAAVKAPGFGDRRKEMLQDMAILTGGTLIAEELGAKIENVEIAALGKCQESSDRQGQHDDRRRRRQEVGNPGTNRIDPPPDRRDHFRLRSREAAGAAGQAHRRRRRDQGWRGDRSRAEGKKGARRRRRPCAARRGRGGNRAGRRRRAGARDRGGEVAQTR